LVMLGTIEIVFRCDETKTWPSSRRWCRLRAV